MRRDGIEAAGAAVAAATTADRRLEELLRTGTSPHHPGHRAAMTNLEEAVCAVVDELHASALAPEKVLVILKARVATQAAYPDVVLDDVVRWCIARYYHSATRAKGAIGGPATDGAPHGTRGPAA